MAAPGPVRRVVEFRAGEIAAAIVSSCDQHFAVGQQRRRVLIACGVEAPGGTSRSRRRVVEFRACENSRRRLSACDEHLAVVQQRRRVI